MKLLMLIMTLVLSAPVFATIYYVTDGVYFGYKNISGSDTLIMTGGGLCLTGLDNSILDIRSTSSPVVTGKSGIIDVDVWGASQLYFSGGCAAHISLGGDATAVLSGGAIARLKTTQAAWKWVGDGRDGVLVANPHVEILCKNYQYDTTSKILTGTWEDSSLFSIRLVDVAGYSPTIDNIQFTLNPEPATILLLGSGFLLLRKKK